MKRREAKGDAMFGKGVSLLVVGACALSVDCTPGSLDPVTDPILEPCFDGRFTTTLSGGSTIELCVRHEYTDGDPNARICGDAFHSGTVDPEVTWIGFALEGLVTGPGEAAVELWIRDRRIPSAEFHAQEADITFLLSGAGSDCDSRDQFTIRQFSYAYHDGVGDPVVHQLGPYILDRAPNTCPADLCR